MEFWVIVPVHNGAKLLDRCLESLACQNDLWFNVVVADDASTEWDEVRATLDRYVPALQNFSWTHREENVGATRNIVEAIDNIPMAGDDVVVIVDGDDQLSHYEALARLRQHFTDDVELAYGSYVPEPFEPGCQPARPLPPDVLAAGTIRDFTHTHGQWFNHPYAFRRRLFDRIEEVDYHLWLNEDPALPEQWLRFSYDMVMMLPLIEAAGRRVAWVPDFLYLYTSDRAEAVWRIHNEEAAAEAMEVMLRPRRYWP